MQERKLDRLGSEKSININIRVISATNKDLKAMIDKGEFRLDLYYRLNVIPIELPSLKKRGDDIFLLSDYIIINLSARLNKGQMTLSNEVKDLFESYQWPGNIRELENVLEHGICFSRDGTIRVENLPDYIREKAKKDYLEKKYEKATSLDQLKAEFEKSVINELIEEHGNTVEGKKEIANKLNIGLTTLYRKINEY